MNWLKVKKKSRSGSCYAIYVTNAIQVNKFVLFLLLIYFALVCSQFTELFQFSHQIYGNLGRSILTQNKQIGFLSLSFNSIHGIVFYSPCVTVIFMCQTKSTIEFSMHICLTQTMFTPIKTAN